MAVSAEEVAAAKKLLEGLNEKGKKSKMTSMVHLCKNSDEDTVLSSRGAARDDYLEKLIIHQQRNEKAKKTTTVTNETNHVKQKEEEKEWMGMETMDLKLGAVRAQHLRDASAFTKRSCPHTGSKEDVHCEWEVPKHLSRTLQQDLKGLKIDGQNDTEDADYDLLRSTLAFDAGAAPLKVEPAGESETSKIAAKLDVFISTKDAVLRKFQDFKVDAKTALAKARTKTQSTRRRSSPILKNMCQNLRSAQNCWRESAQRTSTIQQSFQTSWS